MINLRKAAEMALEALEDSMYPQKKQFDAIVGLKQALAQPEPWDTSDMAHRAGGLSVEQEPVAFMEALFDNDCAYAYADGWNACVQAHKRTAPPSKPWVSLTDDEMPTLTYGLERITFIPFGETKRFIRKVEAALRSKNDCVG